MVQSQIEVECNMERLPLEEYDPQGLKSLTEIGRPIPGQSLTKDPNEKYPWEGPTEFTNFKDALDYTVSELIEEDAYVSVISGIGQGVPISDVVMQIVYAGFKSGKWNPDLMLLLIEPLMYVMIALCEKAGVDYILYSDEEEDDDNEEINTSNTELEQLKELTKTKISIDSRAIPASIVQQIEDLEVPTGLLSKTEQPMQQEAPQEASNLLDRQE